MWSIHLQYKSYALMETSQHTAKIFGKLPVTLIVHQDRNMHAKCTILHGSMTIFLQLHITLPCTVLSSCHAWSSHHGQHGVVTEIRHTSMIMNNPDAYAVAVHASVPQSLAWVMADLCRACAVRVEELVSPGDWAATHQVEAVANEATAGNQENQGRGQTSQK